MRWIGVLLVLVALVLPAAWAGGESRPEISDPADDVTRDGAAVHDDLAGALDLLAVWWSQDAGGHNWVHIKVAGLGKIATLAKGPDFSAQYAAVFTSDGGPTYQVMASSGGTKHGAPGSWRCQAEDRSTTKWSEADGRIDVAHGILHILLPPAASAAWNATKVSVDLSAQAWGSDAPDGRPQTTDWATATLPKVHGLDAPAQEPSPDLLRCNVPVAAPGAVTWKAGTAATPQDPQVPDPAGDTVRSTDDKDVPASDALAKALDITGIWFTKDQEGDYWSHMGILDLPGASPLLREDHLSLQYAATLAFGADTRDFQVSATTDGSDYANPAGSWRCMVEDTHTSKWTDTAGLIDTEHGQIHVRLTPEMKAKLEAGAQAHDLGGQAWGSVAEKSRPQTDDWASSRSVFKAADLPVQPAPSGDGLLPCGESGLTAVGGSQPQAWPVQPAAFPSGIAFALLLLGLAFLRRRQ